MRVCQYVSQHDKWEAAINKRTNMGKELTKSQKQKYEAWLTDSVQTIVFNKKRQCYVGDARSVNKDCIVLRLQLSYEPESLKLSTSGPEATVFRLVLLKHNKLEDAAGAVPKALDKSVSEAALAEAAHQLQTETEGNDDADEDDGGAKKVHDDGGEDFSEQQIHEMSDEKFETENNGANCDGDEDEFQILGDSDDELDEAMIKAACAKEKVHKVKSFHLREAWLSLEKLGLTELPRHITGCGLGYHQSSQQWQAFYPSAKGQLSWKWGGKTNRSECQAILRAVRCILEAHVKACPKEKIWAVQLTKVKEAETKPSF